MFKETKNDIAMTKLQAVASLKSKQMLSPGNDSWSVLGLTTPRPTGTIKRPLSTKMNILNLPLDSVCFFTGNRLMKLGHTNLLPSKYLRCSKKRLPVT